MHIAMHLIKQSMNQQRLQAPNDPKALGMLVDMPSCGLWFCAEYCHTKAAFKEDPLNVIVGGNRW